MMRATLSTCALLLALSHPLYAVSELPAPGMSMQAVESQFGQPSKKTPAVGNPPITRWEYGDYVVVFERATVISSIRVVRQASTATTTQPAASPPAQTQPAPAPAPAVPVEPASPPVTEAPQPAAAPAAEPVAAPAAPAEATDSSARATQEQEAMEKAAAEKAAAEGAQPAAPTPSEGDSAPSPNQGYTFDPETGRIIIK